MTARASAIYTGTVSHVRRGPRPHAFSYRTYMLYLDLDELPGLGIRSFRRADYLGDPSRDLAGDLGFVRGGVEARDPPDPRLAGAQRLPCRRDAGAHRADQPEACDNNPFSQKSSLHAGRPPAGQPLPGWPARAPPPGAPGASAAMAPNAC